MGGQVGAGPRVRAPELDSGPWFNTAAPLRLADLRGRFVLLDFWTAGCGNCLHVLDELRPLEHSHADVLTVVGVHSAKFPHERLASSVAAAVARYGVRHPVVSDPDLELWRQYAVRAWPTLVLVDPQGYVVAQAAGEGHVPALSATLDRLVTAHDAAGTLQRGPSPISAPSAADTVLRFPAKAIVAPATRTGRAQDTLLVADAGHDRLVELADDGSLLRVVGSGVRGRLDGDAETARFAEPNGLTLLPGGFGYDVLVADTANHVLRGVRLADGAVVATLDLPAALVDTRTVTGPVPAVLSPWDVAWWPARGRAVVAAAGVHLLLEVDPADGRTTILAGTTVEGLRDGPGPDAWLAQPSGLAVDGDTLWFVDAESSALRRIDAAGTVVTEVGEGLFDWGHVDGPAPTARLQHPLGVAVLDDAGVVVADTYNGAVRRFDPLTRRVTTLADGLAEPSGLVAGGGRLLVVESADHRVRPVDVHQRDVAAPTVAATRPAVRVRPGRVHLRVAFALPAGQRLDDADGAPTRLSVSAAAGVLTAGAGDSIAFERDLDVAGPGVLQVVAQVATCDDDPAEPFPACHLVRQDWGVPVELADDGDTVVELMLLG